MKKYIEFLLAIVIPLLLVEALLNYFVDPNGLYYNYSEKNEKMIAKAMADGYYVTSPIGYQEGSLKRSLVEAFKGEEMDFVVFGASRVMTVCTDAFDGKKTLNLGASTSQMEDIIAFYEICKENGIKMKNAFIGIDPTFLTDNYNGLRWVTNSVYYYRFKGEESSDIDYKALTNLISPSYTQLSILELPSMLRRFFKPSSTEEEKEEVFCNEHFVTTRYNDGLTFFPDGGFSYAREFRERPQSVIDGKAAVSANSTFNPSDKVSKKDQNELMLLIADMKKNGINVIFFCAPYHPLFYSRVVKMSAVNQMMDYIYHFAEDNNILVIGSFDPKECGMTNKDFYDAVHLKSEVINYFINKEITKSDE